MSPLSIVKSLARRLLPHSATVSYRRWKRGRMDRINAASTTEEVFTRIYRRGQWGRAGRNGEPCSGEGSLAASIVDPYVERVTAVLRALGMERRRIVDLGCGDFRVGRRLTHLAGAYVGVDIVADLVASHGREFATERVSFVQANLVTDQVPEGDVAFLRQVLQHLSNEQVAAILSKLDRYRYTIVTEHYPRPEDVTAPNLDKIQGHGVRLYAGSGVYLDQPPFGISPARLVPVLEVEAVGFTDLPDPGLIRTWVLCSSADAEAARQRLEQANLLWPGLPEPQREHGGQPADPPP